MNTMNKYLTLFLALLLITAAALSSGCTEAEDEEPVEGPAEETPEEADNIDENTVPEENSLHGMIIFDEPVQSFSDVTVYLKVEDVSLQDVASVTVAESSIDNVSLDADAPEPVTYTISYPELDERMMYSLPVHVDVDGDGSLSGGDYYSTWHNPVPTEPGVHELDVHVELI